MARDSRVRMRDGLVIPGVLLTFYGVLAIIYAEQLRAKSDFCPDSDLILIAGTCYTVWKIILPMVLIGLALLITGIVAFRGHPEELEGHLHHGSVAHSGLALMVSLLVVPFGAWVVQTSREAASGKSFELNILGARYEHTFLLELVMLIALLMLIPFLSLYFSLHVKRRRFLGAATELLSEQDEPPLPHERGFEYGHHVPLSQAQAAPMVPDEEWPDGRDLPPEGGRADDRPRGAMEPAASDRPAQPGPRGEPRPAAAPEEQESCRAEEGRCPNPVPTGMKFCAVHACQGLTREGGPCRNPSLPGASFCQVHKR